MTGIEQGLVIGALMLVLLALRVHIGVAMFAAGSVGYVWVSGLGPLLSYFQAAAYARYSVYDLSVVPLFLLMGQFATHGGLSRALFNAGNALIGHWRGGMAMAAISACAGFGAICGSSLATAATMGQVALPELRRQAYSPRLATAVTLEGVARDVTRPVLQKLGPSGAWLAGPKLVLAPDGTFTVTVRPPGALTVRLAADGLTGPPLVIPAVGTPS